MNIDYFIRRQFASKEKKLENQKRVLIILLNHPFEPGGRNFESEFKKKDAYKRLFGDRIKVVSLKPPIKDAEKLHEVHKFAARELNANYINGFKSIAEFIREKASYHSDIYFNSLTKKYHSALQDLKHGDNNGKKFIADLFEKQLGKDKEKLTAGFEKLRNSLPQNPAKLEESASKTLALLLGESAPEEYRESLTNFTNSELKKLIGVTIAFFSYATVGYFDSDCCCRKISRV